MTEIKHDEDLLEQLYWEFDNARKKGEERLKFKALLRSYATKMAAKNLSMKQTDDTTQSHVPKISQSTFNTNTVADPLLPKDVAILMEAAMNARACGLIAGTSNWAAFMSKFLTGDHEDDTAVYRFALAMKEKMEQARAKGRGGWNDPVDCSTERLQEMLLNHIEKGDPVDVANFCMMLWTRGAPTKDSSKENLTSRPAWEQHAEKFVQWKHRLSYNDSYVGEPAGLFKQVAFALDRLIGQDIETARVEALNILTSFRNDDNNTIFDFDESQWWVKELDEIRRFPDTTAFTDDMRRAVAVVHHLLRLIVNLKEHLDDNLKDL